MFLSVTNLTSSYVANQAPIPRACFPAPRYSTPHQALFEEGAGGAAPENRLANFLRDSVNGPVGEEGAGADSVMESDEEGEGGGLW